MDELLKQAAEAIKEGMQLDPAMWPVYLAGVMNGYNLAKQTIKEAS